MTACEQEKSSSARRRNACSCNNGSQCRFIENSVVADWPFRAFVLVA